MLVWHNNLNFIHLEDKLFRAKHFQMSLRVDCCDRSQMEIIVAPQARLADDSRIIHQHNNVKKIIKRINFMY